jgi:hypothetical protein
MVFDGGQWQLHVVDGGNLPKMLGLNLDESLIG